MFYRLDNIVRKLRSCDEITLSLRIKRILFFAIIEIGHAMFVRSHFLLRKSMKNEF